MFLIEDVRVASPSQIAARKAHVERRANWFAKIKVENKVMETVVAPTIQNDPAPEPVAVYPAHVPGNAKTVVNLICSVCSTQFHVDANDILSDRRQKQKVVARHAAFWIAKCVTTWSLPEVGRRLGNRDHTTVLHALRKVEKRIFVDAEYAHTLKKLKATVLERMQNHHNQAAVPALDEQPVL